MNQRFEDLTIETAEDKNGQFIILSQDGGGNTETVAIHEIHLRYMAEKWGLIEKSDPQTKTTVATLQRRLLALRARMETLHDYLVNNSDHKHADLTYEVTYATATLDLADEFCAEFECANQPSEASPSTVAASPALHAQIELV
jgi:hypothetical protein